MDSILKTIRPMADVEPDCTDFDDVLIPHINSTFRVLKQLGVGPKEGFFIEDETAVWTDFIDNPVEVAGIKTYMSQKVKLAFDTSSLTGAVIQAMKESIAEFEWRLNVDAETP